MSEMPPRMARLGRFFTNNLGLKILAVALAVLIWYTIKETISFQMLIESVPVEIQVKPGLAILHQSVDAVNIYFRGSQEDLRMLDQRQIKVLLDLSGSEIPGSGEIQIRAQNVKGAHAATPLQIVPNSVKIELDREIVTQVPVKGRTAGNPLIGEVDKVVCDPTTVAIKGPEQRVKTVDWLYTEPIDVDGRIASFSKTCRVVAPSTSWRAELTPANVQVEVSIVHQSESREWKDLPITAMVAPGEPLKAAISPARAAVTATGRTEMIGKLEKTAPKIFVDCSGLEFAVPYELPLNVSIPPGVDVTVKIEPAFVRVTMEIVSGLTQSLENHIEP